MNSTSFYGVMDLLITLCGAYVIYQYIIMASSHTIRQNMLMPKDLDVKKCKDVEGYIRFIGVRQIGFGATAVICGIIGLVQDFMGVYNMPVSIGSIIVFLLFCIWYGKAMMDAQKKFW